MGEKIGFGPHPERLHESKAGRRVEQNISEALVLVRQPPAEFIHGEMVKRISGSFAFRNIAGKDVNVYFCGTTHEQEKLGNRHQDVSTEERVFIDASLERILSMKGVTILCESGITGQEQNGILRVLQEAGERMPQIKTLMNDVLAMANRHKMDLDYVGLKAHQLGKNIRNVDMSLNVDAIQEVLESQGEEEAVRFCCRCLKGGVFYGRKKEILQIGPGVLVWELVKAGHLDGQINQARCAQIATDEFSQQLSPSLTNKERDAFMAKNLRKQKGAVFFAAHTRHVLGVIASLQHEIYDFNLPTIEVAKIVLKQWEELVSKESGREGLKTLPE